MLIQINTNIVAMVRIFKSLFRIFICIWKPGKNVITFGADMCILIIKIKISLSLSKILPEGPTQGLHDTTLRAEAKYPINFTQSIKKFV